MGRLIGLDILWPCVNSADISPRPLFADRIFSRTLNIHKRRGTGAPETISGMALSRSLDPSRGILQHTAPHPTGHQPSPPTRNRALRFESNFPPLALFLCL